MGRKRKTFFKIYFCTLLMLVGTAGCAASPRDVAGSDEISLVATTTMLADLSREIGAGRVHVAGLMGAGVDPHLYQASAGDVQLMQQANIVVHNGLHLEGKMGDVFDGLAQQGMQVICVSSGIAEENLLTAEDDPAVFDPHIWFDVSLWKQAAQTLAQGLIAYDPAGEAVYSANLQAYLARLDALDEEIFALTRQLPAGQRVLVTAHDAFRYFAARYDFRVYGLQGISTQTQAGTADVRELADLIVREQVRTIFPEQSVSEKSMQALQRAVRARGFEVEVGASLYSDSLGDAQSGTEDYISTFLANVTAIVRGLQ